MDRTDRCSVRATGKSSPQPGASLHRACLRLKLVEVPHIPGVTSVSLTLLKEEDRMSNRQSWFLLPFVLLASALLFSQNSSVHGVDLSDLDRKAEPCSDFFEF